MKIMRHLIIFFSLQIHVVLIATITLAQTAPIPYNKAEWLYMVNKLEYLGSAMYIAAHPDDENTRVIAWLSSLNHIETYYLSLTRGDGGQNLIGTEQGNTLGILRTQELLEARKIDGGYQLFTRAIDFGFSKSPSETFNHWNKDSILSDIVFAIRKYKPEILICRFGTDGSGGHGHHTASAILAEVAFNLAGDSRAFPHQLNHVSIWQPKRLVWNFWQNRVKVEGKIIQQDVSGYIPEIGRSVGELAAWSRSKHSSQGFGTAPQKGKAVESFLLLKDTNTKQSPSETDLLSGLDFSFNKISWGHIYLTQLQLLKQAIKQENKDVMLKKLIELRKIILKYNTGESYLEKKIQVIDHLVLGLIPIQIEATSPNQWWGQGTVQKIDLSAIAYTNTEVKIRWDGVQLGSFYRKKQLNHFTISQHEWKKITDTIYISHTQSISIPHWLQQPTHADMYHISDLNSRCLPSTDDLYTQITIFYSSDSLTIKVPLEYKWVNPSVGELVGPVSISPKLTISSPSPIEVWSPNDKKTHIFKYNITSLADSLQGRLYIDSNFISTFQLPEKGKQTVISVTCAGNAMHKTLKLFVNNQPTTAYTLQQIEPKHIRPQSYFAPFAITKISIPFICKAKKIGYIPGAGDLVAECLLAAGLDVEIISAHKLSALDLKNFDAIVVGIRAFNVSEALVAQIPLLLSYVKNGGNLLVQYNTNNWISGIKTNFGPYPFTISRYRVTDEKSHVHFTYANDPILNYPNQITAIHFENWIQERGIYFAENIAEVYKTPLQFQDINEPLHNGSLLYTPYGKGNFIYTGLSFFRQLPAGVSGAYALFYNMLSLGK